MYTPALFVEDRTPVLHAFIKQHPLAAIVTSGPDGLEATHVPVVLQEGLEGSAGVLRCHFARANNHWKSIQSSPQVLAIFQGFDHYISPAWYPSKQEHGKVVPTWNYVAVHVRGRARLFEEQKRILEHLRVLTDQNESQFEAPWSVQDAPNEYIEAMTKAIIGVEISIEAIEGKCKASQNRPAEDRAGVAAGLKAIGSSAAIEMSKLVERGRLE